MTEERNAMANLFAACWKDDALKARFMSDPKAVLAEHGMEVPDDMNVEVVENSDSTVHITLPAPPEGVESLSHEDLASAVGGTNLPGCASSVSNWTCVYNPVKAPNCGHA